jgi:peptidoglycan/LPS O-acetylase OafA/YrhL
MFSSDKYIKNRIFGLDLIRALALVCVLVSHTGWARIFGFRYGVLAVDYFFVLSGFLVGEMLLIECTKGSDRKTILNFMIKRWFRTLPLYFLILLIKFAVQRPFLGANIFPYLFFMQNNFGGISFFPVSWTLVIEEWFYLVLPFLIYVFFRSGITKKKFLYFSIAIVVLENVGRFIMVYYFHRKWGGLVGNFPLRFDSFFIGVFLAFVKLNYANVYEKMRKPLFFSVAFVVAAITIVAYTMSRGGELDEGNSLWVRTVGFFIISFVLTLLVPFFEQNPVINKPGSKNFFRLFITWISLLSYPMYLIHTDVLHYFNAYNLHIVWFVLISYLVIIGISLLLFLFFHHPVTQLRKKFLIK